MKNARSKTFTEQPKVLEVNNGYSVNDDGGVLALLIKVPARQH